MLPNGEHPNIELEVFEEWRAENQPRITNAVLSALSRVSGVAEALTELGVIGAERVRQRVGALVTAAHAVLPEYMGESFQREFTDLTPGLAEALRGTTASIASDDIEIYIDELIVRYGR